MYLGWIWVVSLFLRVAAGLDGVGELGWEGQSRGGCEPQGAAMNRAGRQHGWSYSGTGSCVSSPAPHSPAFPVAHDQAFPSVPWEPQPTGDPGTDLTRPLPVWHFIIRGGVVPWVMGWGKSGEKPSILTVRRKVQEGLLHLKRGWLVPPRKESADPAHVQFSAWAFADLANARQPVF